MKKLKYLFLIALLGNCAAWAHAEVGEDGDWQYWNTEEIEYKFADKWKAKLEQELRFGDGMGKLFYEHTQAGVAYDLEKWLNVGVFYRGIFENVKNKWLYEARPLGDVTVKQTWMGFDLEDRNRLEYRFLENREDMWRYRNRIMLKLPWKFTAWEFRPYTSNEFFIYFNEEGYAQNRMYGGIEFKPFKHVKAEIFYMWKASKKSTGWIDNNIFGTKIKISF